MSAQIPYRLALGSALALAACSTPTIITPTRSLDRPSDVALLCAAWTPDRQTVLLPLETCDGDNPVAGLPVPPGQTGGYISDGGVYPAQLFTLTTNTARGELSVTTTAASTFGTGLVSTGPAIVDLDPNTPEYGFIPLGKLPEHIRETDDGCRAITANTDGCDLSVVDTARLMSSLAGDIPRPELLSDYVRRVVPTSGGVPIGARPTWLEVTPASTGLASAPPNDPPGASVDACDKADYHALVAFPACELVGEIDLATGALVHAVQVGKAGARVIDPDTVRCPAECAGVPLDGGVSDSVPDGSSASDGGSATDAAVADGGSPSDMAAPADLAVPVDAGAPSDGGSVPPILPSSQAYPSSFAVDSESKRLFVGDALGASITVVPYGDDGSFGTPGRITLAETPEGVERVRLSPRITDPAVQGDPGIRYLYAIARDLSIRVIDTDHLTECETNPDGRILNQRFPISDPSGNVVAGADPQAIIRALRCLPVGDPATPPREPRASTPGITLPFGALPRDVAFVHVKVPPAVATGQIAVAGAAGLVVGDFAFVIESEGHAVTVNIADRCPQPNDPSRGIDPTVACDPQAFAGSVAEAVGYAGAPVPVASDLLPNHLRNGQSRFIQPPSYDDPSGTPRLTDLPQIATAGVALDPFNDSVPNMCSLGTGLVDGGAIDRVHCVGEPADIQAADFVAFHDPQSAHSETWSLTWEGALPGTIRATGSLAGATFSDLVGSFCTRNVEVGDKLYVPGCTASTDCGPDQQCYFDPGSPDATHGLCVPLDANLFASAQTVCQPWSRAVRRWRVAKTGQTSLMLDELPEPEHPIDTRPCVTDADCAAVTIAGTVGGVVQALPTSCLPVAGGAKQCLRACSTSEVCGVGFLCTQSQYDPAGTQRCLRAPMPPADPTAHGLCFGELLGYEIHAGEAFEAFGDSTTSTLPTLFTVDPSSGACLPSPLHPPDTGYLRARVPIDPPRCADSVNTVDWLAPLPQPGPNSCRLVPAPDDPTRTFVRYESVALSLIVDVTSHSAIAGETDDGGVDGGLDLDGGVAQMIPYTRVPDEGTVITAVVVGGWRPLAATLGATVSAQLPRNALVAPDGHTLYIVDEGKQTVATGLRGQLIRFDGATQVTDTLFAIQ